MRPAKIRSAWVSSKSCLHLRCLHEEALGPLLTIECTSKTQIRLGRCPGWSESSVSTHAILLVLSCWGPIFVVYYSLQNMFSRQTHIGLVSGPAKTQISLAISPVWSASLLSAWRNTGSIANYWAHSQDSDLTGQIPRLIRVFAGRTCHFVGSVLLRPNFCSLL